MWDDVQREILAALGHAPMVLAPPELPDDPLLHALLRAAGCDAQAPSVADVLRALPPTATVRGNPGGKRALWPRLRSLRRRA
ncbi:hypothetical protein [Cognatiluteimonas telluris]|jgi:hypothetical protein|uniref:hypothetical protein n=1 Tax=Cognatiluteimonas telluris TaxID=1104775 RepID=UPI00140C8D76|nr:hypothetical protein [Lysobacter telluris]